MIRKRMGPALVLKKIFDIMSVNGYGGVIWYHDWHGDHARSLEDH